MGLFSSKKIITVSSTLYNMAGDERDRPDFLKATVFSSVISNSPSIADDLNTAYMGGPGLQQRQFFRYCDRNDVSGTPTATIVNTVALNPQDVQPHIPASPVPPAPVGLNLRCYAAEVTDGSFEAWIERWILENHPTRIGEDWLGDYEPTTNEFSVEFPNNDTFIWTNNIAPVYSPAQRYIVAKYIEYLDDTEEPVQTGAETVNDPVLPDTTGFTNLVTSGTFTPVTLQRVRNTILSYNNGDPDVQVETNVDADVPGEVHNWSQEWERETVTSVSGIQVEGLRELLYIQATDVVTNDYTSVVVTQTPLGGGVIETRTETTTGEQVTDQYTHRTDTQILLNGSQYGPEQVFIYQIGSGNVTLDALLNDVDISGLPQEFFPFMPVRINNKSVAHPDYASLFEEMSKAYKRGFGYKKNFGSLVTSVEENPSIADIDYAYLCFGASLNVKEMACRRYIFKFFETIIPFQFGGSGDAMGNLQTEIDAYNAALEVFHDWEAIVRNSNQDWQLVPSRPEIPSISPPPTNTIKLADENLGFDLRMVWVHAQVDQFNGTFTRQDSDAVGQQSKNNDIELRVGTPFSWSERLSYNTWYEEEPLFIQKSIPSMEIWWQTDPGSYRVMTVWGLVSYNYIYGGKAVVITSTEALQDTEESGFLVPLHYPTMLEMGIVDYTQMSTANSHILFNSYKVTKKRWYQRGIFKILLTIAIIIVAVIAFPGAFAAGGGILGGNLALGTALGLTGTAALVAGVVANYIASIIVAEVLKIVGTALFGEKWGALFAAIAGFAIGAAMTGTKLFSAKEILNFGNALANGYAGWVQGNIAEMQEELVEEQNTYEDTMDKINELLKDLYNQNGLNFNPMSLMDSLRNTGGSGGYLPETLDGYISRTTMTGGDVVDLTLAMVNDFVEIQQTLPRN